MIPLGPIRIPAGLTTVLESRIQAASQDSIWGDYVSRISGNSKGEANP